MYVCVHAHTCVSVCTRVCVSVGIKKREQVWKSKWQKGGLYNENSYSEEKEKAGKADMVSLRLLGAQIKCSRSPKPEASPAAQRQ